MTHQENQVGLIKAEISPLVKQLNELLSNYQSFYINVRGFHWNIKGKHFFELHEKFEELYNDLKEKLDEIAERILTLGFTPLHSYQDYLERTRIPSSKNISSGVDAVTDIVKSLTLIIEIQREILQHSDQLNDEGTNALMSDYIREQEKLVWMYNAFLAS